MSKVFEKTTIVIAEDDEDDALLIKEALGDAGFAGQIVFFPHGRALVDSLNGNSASPDLILLDLQMPMMNGREALSHIKHDERLLHIPVVVHSTSRNNEDISFCYKNGASSYVQKSSSYDGLIDNMRTIVKYWFKTAVLPPR